MSQNTSLVGVARPARSEDTVSCIVVEDGILRRHAYTTFTVAHGVFPVSSIIKGDLVRCDAYHGPILPMEFGHTLVTDARDVLIGTGNLADGP